MLLPCSNDLYAVGKHNILLCMGNTKCVICWVSYIMSRIPCFFTPLHALYHIYNSDWSWFRCFYLQNCFIQISFHSLELIVFSVWDIILSANSQGAQQITVIHTREINIRLGKLGNIFCIKAFICLSPLPFVCIFLHSWKLLCVSNYAEYGT